MKLTEVDCSVSDEWADAMAQGLASMNAPDAQVVVTTQFVETVAEMTGNPSYTTERGGGVVAARTVNEPGGPVVVVNYNELSSRPSADIQRLLAHEAGHVLINARGTEEMSGNRDSNETDWQWWLKCLGGLAIVEFRIERSLIDLGYPAAEPAVATAVDNNLLMTNVEVVNAVVDPTSDDPVHLHDMLLATLSHVTKILAYIAAPLIVGQAGFSPSQLTVDGQVNWADYIAPTWQQRIALWTPIPSAIESIPIESWRTILRKSAVLEQALLLDFGFAFTNETDGYGFFRKSPDHVFTRRLNRARTQTGMQPDGPLGA